MFLLLAGVTLDMTQLWQVSAQLVGWLKSDTENKDCSCDWLNDEDQDDIQEFSGVGTLMVITMLGGLFIWFNLMPRSSCASSAESRSQREPNHQLQQLQQLQQQQQQQLQLQQQQQQQQHLQLTRSMLQMELKEEKFKDAEFDSEHDTWHDATHSEDEDLERLHRNLNASLRTKIHSATAISISVPAPGPIHFILHKSKPKDEKEEEQPVKHLTTINHTDLPIEINEIDIYHDPPLAESEDEERFQDPLSEERDEDDRFVDSLDN